jgi:hypothetical protein
MCKHADKNMLAHVFFVTNHERMKHIPKKAMPSKRPSFSHAAVRGVPATVTLSVMMPELHDRAFEEEMLPKQQQQQQQHPTIRPPVARMRQLDTAMTRLCVQHADAVLNSTFWSLGHVQRTADISTCSMDAIPASRILREWMWLYGKEVLATFVFVYVTVLTTSVVSFPFCASVMIAGTAFTLAFLLPGAVFNPNVTLYLWMRTCCPNALS